MISWLQQRRRAGQTTPGMYLCWELMVGNSNCRWHWVDQPGAPEPEIPWCGLLWPDTTPVSLAEAAAIRRYTTGESDALFFEDFESHHARAWRVCGKRNIAVRNAAKLEPDMKIIAGKETWTDYLLEGRVAIKPADGEATGGGAGLLIRVSDAGEAPDEIRGYAVTFDTHKLVLGRLEGGHRQTLATYDLTRLKCDTRVNEWSLIRIAAAGPRIRVWFNRLHPSSDPARGLRIDFTDKHAPILSGAIGACTRHVSAMVDNVVVLPSDALPQG
jgi:hypothetical protein